jgi:hypothetical protein
MPATNATAATGRLSRNTECHDQCSSMKPLTIIPMAAPPPDTAVQMAMARARSPAGNTLVRIDSVDGMIMAPARPMTARAPISPAPLVVKKVAKPVASTNKISPACITPLRPKRSPSELVVNSSPANTSE